MSLRFWCQSCWRQPVWKQTCYWYTRNRTWSRFWNRYKLFCCFVYNKLHHLVFVLRGASYPILSGVGTGTTSLFGNNQNKIGSTLGTVGTFGGPSFNTGNSSLNFGAPQQPVGGYFTPLWINILKRNFCLVVTCLVEKFQKHKDGAL